MAQGELPDSKRVRLVSSGTQYFHKMYAMNRAQGICHVEINHNRGVYFTTQQGTLTNCYVHLAVRSARASYG